MKLNTFKVKTNVFQIRMETLRKGKKNIVIKKFAMTFSGICRPQKVSYFLDIRKLQPMSLKPFL